MHPQLDVAVDARAVFDVMAATDARDLEGCSLQLHFVSVPDRLAQCIVRRMHWADTRGMLADGLTKGGFDRTLLHKASNDCKLQLAHQALTHTTISVVGPATKPIDNDGP